MSEPCPADITGTLQALGELGHGTEAARSFRQSSHTVFGPHLTREDRPRSPLGAPGTFVGFAFPALPRVLTHSGRPHEGWAAVAAFSRRRPSRAESGGFGTAARQPPATPRPDQGVGDESHGMLPPRAPPAAFGSTATASREAPPRKLGLSDLPARETSRSGGSGGRSAGRPRLYRSLSAASPAAPDARR